MTIKEMIARQSEITKLARSENRDLTDEETREFNELQGKIDAAKNATPAAPAATGTPDNDETVRQAARAAEKSRIADITAMCRSFGIDPQPHIDSDVSVDECRKLVLEELQKSSAPINAGRVTVTESGEDKFRAAASDGLRPRH